MLLIAAIWFAEYSVILPINALDIATSDAVYTTEKDRANTIERIHDLDIHTGDEIEKMSFNELKERANNTTIFAKLNPEQKSLIVKALKRNNHVVGFMGDGINDTPAMKESDIAISVDSAVDIAKETADIVLLEKDLSILGKGIIQGRKTFANIIKYIKLVISGNFGNMLSILIAIC